MVQKISLEVKVKSPKGLTEKQLRDIKKILKYTLNTYDEFTNIQLYEEYEFPETVSVNV